MGSMVLAKCTNCDFEKEFDFGAGMMDFQTICNVPAISTKTGKFLTKNIFDKEKLKGRYLFYSDKSMHLGTISQDDLQWGDIWLKRNENFCPVCKSFSLRFDVVGLFD